MQTTQTEYPTLPPQSMVKQFEINLKSNEHPLANFIACSALVFNTTGKGISLEGMLSYAKDYLERHDIAFKYTTVNLKEDVLTIRERDKLILQIGYKDVFHLPNIQDEKHY